MDDSTVKNLAICSLSTKELIDKIFIFVEEFTRSKRIGRGNLYTYQKLFARRIIESIIL